MTRACQGQAARIELTLSVAVFAIFAVVVSACAAGVAASGSRAPAQMVPGGDPERGRQVLQAYGCGSCHTIPGVAGATGRVAPPLNDWGTRTTILGLVPNTPEQLIQWIRAPETLRSGTTMLNVGVTEEDARQMAAYLYTLR